MSWYPNVVLGRFLLTLFLLYSLWRYLVEQEKEEVFISQNREWSDIDADEQEFLDLLQTFGEGFIDLSSYTPDISH